MPPPPLQKNKKHIVCWQFQHRFTLCCFRSLPFSAITPMLICCTPIMHEGTVEFTVCMDTELCYGLAKGSSFLSQSVLSNVFFLQL